MSTDPDVKVSHDVLRKVYRTLSEEEILQINEIKDIGGEFISACSRIGKSRELSLAITKMEEAVMWATKYISGDKHG